MSGSAYADTKRGGDTDFRRKWDRNEYAALAAEREEREKAEAKERWEAKMGKKKREASPENAKSIIARKAQDYSEVINKSILVPMGAAIGRRGKGAGFYCEACDETYKDNNSWIDHINSKQHLKKTGQTFHQERATLEECRARLAYLKRKRHENREEQAYDIEKRLQERRRVEAEEKRAKKAAKDKKKAEGRAARDVSRQNEQVKAEPLDDEQSVMASMMGFGGFGSTKV